MSASTCICGREYRKGTIVSVLTQGQILRKRVCPDCAKKCARILATPLIKGRLRGPPGQTNAHILAIRKRAEVWRVGKTISEYVAGLAEGLDMAAGYLESGKWPLASGKNASTPKGGAR